MNTITSEIEPVAIRSQAKNRLIHVELTDGRIIAFPADRFRILKEASENELREVRVEVGGYALRWDALDEDLTVAGVVVLRLALFRG
ncbi:MAG: Protein of unknown function (DUF2442) [Candidatus Kentron sp. G]|nr:MAG: Protein of unknown function (DUF2442) [Candidatus Kentron sp. G]VFN03792.1 MAG: Protein of unknown function (DUF2442) [Candidatus Kentron sp. G]VFN05087.1 MAG: Protein of unknown function (DUF2442) [Candidatus Kentron sp. G]